LLEKTSLCNYDSKNPAFLSITVELF
jgi:hypothetical protein